jgi:hypothetical protein
MLDTLSVSSSSILFTVLSPAASFELIEPVMQERLSGDSNIDSNSSNL